MKKKTFVIIFFCVSFLLSNNVFAKNNEESFSLKEIKEIKKMVKESLIREFENPGDEWKKIIGSKMLKDGSISAKKVGKGIAKKKTQSGEYPKSERDADKILCDERDVDECNYYVKITISDVAALNTSIIMVYEKANDDFEQDVWRQSSVQYVGDGYIYIQYASSDNGEVDFEKLGDQYKLVVIY